MAQVGVLAALDSIPNSIVKNTTVQNDDKLAQLLRGASPEQLDELVKKGDTKVKNAAEEELKGRKERTKHVPFGEEFQNSPNIPKSNIPQTVKAQTLKEKVLQTPKAASVEAPVAQVNLKERQAEADTTPITVETAKTNLAKAQGVSTPQKEVTEEPVEFPDRISVAELELVGAKIPRSLGGSIPSSLPQEDFKASSTPNKTAGNTFMGGFGAGPVEKGSSSFGGGPDNVSRGFGDKKEREPRISSTETVVGEILRQKENPLSPPVGRASLPASVSIPGIGSFHFDSLLNAITNEDGTVSTERMGTITNDEGTFLVPFLIPDENGRLIEVSDSPITIRNKDGRLEEIEGNAKRLFLAREQGRASGPFKTVDEAEAFGKERHNFIDQFKTPEELAVWLANNIDEAEGFQRSAQGMFDRLVSDEPDEFRLVVGGATEQDNALFRIAEAMSNQAVETFKGVGIDEIADLRRSVRLGENELIDDFNTLVLAELPQLVAMGFEGMGALIEALGVGAAQTLTEFTGEKEDGVRFLRDIFMPGITYAMFTGGYSATRTLPKELRSGRQFKKAEKTVQEIEKIQAEERVIRDVEAKAIKEQEGIQKKQDAEQPNLAESPFAEIRLNKEVPKKTEGKISVKEKKKRKTKLEKEAEDLGLTVTIIDKPKEFKALDTFESAAPFTEGKATKGQVKGKLEATTVGEAPTTFRIGPDLIVRPVEGMKPNAKGRMGPPKEPAARTRGQDLIEASEKKMGITLPEFTKAELIEHIDNGILVGDMKMGNAALILDQTFLKFLQRRTQRTLDGFHSFKIAEIRDANAHGRLPDHTAYMGARLFKGGFRGQIETFIKKGPLEFLKEDKKVKAFSKDGKTVIEEFDAKAGEIIIGEGKSLEGVLEPVGNLLPEWLDYMVHRRATELREQGRENLFSEVDSAKVFEKFDRMSKEDQAIFKQAEKDYRQLNNQVIKFAVDGGFISAGAADAMLAVNQLFFSMRRVADGIPNIAGIRGRNPNFFRKLKGGTANIREPLENMVFNMAHIVEGTLRNKARRETLLHLESLEINGRPVVVRKAVSAELLQRRKEIADRIIHEAEEVRGTKISERDALDIADSLLTRETMVRDGAGVTEVVAIDGKLVEFVVKDPYLIEALDAFNPINFGKFQKTFEVMGAFSDFLRFGVTMTPEFLIKNVIRDVGQSMILSQQKGILSPLKVIGNAIRGAKDRWNKDDIYWLNSANGGGFATLYRGETNASSSLQLTITKHGLKTQNVFDNIANAFAIGEESVRVGEFRTVLKMGKGLREAAFSAREISTDFALRGTSGLVNVAARAIPFLNARAQGLYRIGRQFKDTPVTTMQKGLLGITLPAMALYAFNKDKKEYQQLPDWTKDQFYVNVADNGEVFLIPKGFEAGAMFATMFERMFEAIEKENGAVFTNALIRMFTQTLEFSPFPQIVKPIAEAGLPFTDFLGLNTTFTGSKVVPTSLENVSPDQQFTASTSTFLVEMSEALKEHLGVELSPLQTQSLIRGYLGTLGMYALDLADGIINTATGRTEATTRIDQMPVLKSFFRNNPQARTQWEADFYDLLADSREASNTVRLMINERGRAPREEDVFLGAVHPSLSATSKLISQLNFTLRQVLQSDSMTAEAKAEARDQILEQRNAIFEAAIKSIPKDLVNERGILYPDYVRRELEGVDINSPFDDRK